jgi:hypothetical protein
MTKKKLPTISCSYDVEAQHFRVSSACGFRKLRPGTRIAAAVAVMLAVVESFDNVRPRAMMRAAIGAFRAMIKESGGND